MNLIEIPTPDRPPSRFALARKAKGALSKVAPAVRGELSAALAVPVQPKPKRPLLITMFLWVCYATGFTSVLGLITALVILAARMCVYKHCEAAEGGERP